MARFRVPRSVETSLICWLAAGLVIWLPGPIVAGDVPVVAAASSLNPMLNEVVLSFSGQTGKSVRVSFGSSGNIARQIIQGAPFELFLSADERYVRSLVDRALTIDRGAQYATGRLVLFVPAGSTIRADSGLQDLGRALDDGRLKRLAIANPEHAPYGRAARQLLEGRGLWPRLSGKLVFGENVSQAAQFASTGNVEAAIFAYSMALSPALSRRGSFVLVPKQWHEPIRHRMVLLNGAGQTALALYAFINEPTARRILEKYGFTSPGAAP